MNFKYKSQYGAWRCTLDTNQYRYGSSRHQPENFGTYACTFIAFEFLASALKIASNQWPKSEGQSQYFLAQDIAHVANLSISAGIDRHEQYCTHGKRRITSKRPKGIALAFHNVIGYPNEHGMKRIIFDEDELRICTVEQLCLNYSPENKNKTLNVHDKTYKEKVGYILGAKNHVISIVRYKDCWLLFNSLPETRGAILPYVYYPFYNAYILCFKGPKAMQNISFYLQNKLWNPGDSVDVYPIYEKSVHGIELNTPITPARGPRMSVPSSIDLDISLESI